MCEYDEHAFRRGPVGMVSDATQESTTCSADGQVRFDFLSSPTTWA
jgi:hypothetical protein